MAQIRMIDEDKLDKLEWDSAFCDVYREILQECQEKLYPDYISVDPVSSYEYDLEILMEMYYELINKRKKWWERWKNFIV